MIRDLVGIAPGSAHDPSPGIVVITGAQAYEVGRGAGAGNLQCTGILQIGGRCQLSAKIDGIGGLYLAIGWHTGTHIKGEGSVCVIQTGIAVGVWRLGG